MRDWRPTVVVTGRECEAPEVMPPPIAGPEPETHLACGDHALKNLRHYFAGGPPSGEVSLETFDRMT
ncbi:MAG TPA: hypothetical protein VIO38_15025 [Rariglobus sp.]